MQMPPKRHGPGRANTRLQRPQASSTANTSLGRSESSKTLRVVKPGGSEEGSVGHVSDHITQLGLLQYELR